MRILVTNDDGIHAPGLVVLEDIARGLSDDVWVIAPEEEQSGAGHSLTLTVPLRIRTISDKRFSVTGTPTDCVMMAIGEIMKDHRPDLILSGVNRGANIAEDVTYSGTVSAAMEGTLARVPSIALSQAIRDWPGNEASFDCARGTGLAVLQKLIAAGWPAGVLLNVNFPPLAPDLVQGVRITSQGHRDLGAIAIDKRQDARGFPYYWLGLGRASEVPGADSDIKALREGFISVTPLHLNLTHVETQASLAGVFLE
jgi:5'-nucleotidase